MPPARSGVQAEAKAEKRSELSQTLTAPTGNVAAEGLGRQPQGAPARLEAEGEPGAKSPYKGAGGRGGGASLANRLRPQRGWRGAERSSYPLAYHSAVVAMEKTSSQRGQYFLLSALRSPDIPGPLFNTRMPEHSESDGVHMPEDSRSPGMREAGLNKQYKLGHAGVFPDSVLRLPGIRKFCFTKATQETECI